MKILLDECIDCRLAKELKGYSVTTVPKMGWAAIENGQLLARAEKQFDVFITADRNLSFQQPLPRFQIKVVVLHGRSNRLSDLKLLVPKILAELRNQRSSRLVRIG